jgi:ABC-type nitrate/sulfonate/bicarbonate transport system substrate-binding protein
VGFLPLTDAAALIAAQVRGDFERHGLQVVLQREVGWATVREKIIFGELDAAAVPAPMLWSTARLRSHGVSNAATLSREARARRGENRLTFGVVCRYSSHHLHLRQWLTAAGLDPDREVRIAVVPPAQMVRNLAEGAIDGFWAGEPWGTVAIRAGLGWSPMWSARHAPGHIEKVLIVTERFAADRAGEHRALITALTEASAWCEAPEHRAVLPKLLAAEPYLNVPARLIRPALEGRFETGDGRVEQVPDFLVLHRGGTNRPREHDAHRLQREMIEAGILPPRTDPALPRRLFRDGLARDFAPDAAGSSIACPSAAVAAAL